MRTLSAIIAFALLCGYLWDREHKQPEIKVVNCHGEAPITVKLADGKKLYPVKTYANQADVQLIMPDGRAIIMPWSKIQVMSSK